MLTFNNELQAARDIILKWEQKELLKEVTIVRDVFGKLSFLMESDIYPEQSQIAGLQAGMEESLQGYFTGKIYWTSMPEKKKKYGRLIMEQMKEGRIEWQSKQGILFWVAERPIAKKAWVAGGYAQDSVWPYEEAVAGNRPKVVTFYSFKGGMGRTTTLAGVALQLVGKGKNVMMIDTDIEAPGLATLFFDDESIHGGVLDYLLENPLSSETDIANYVMDVTEPSLLQEQDGRLYVLPAGRVDQNYLQKLARIDYQDHREGALRRAMGNMLEDICLHYQIDYILIDARAGFHDMGGIAVAQLPHGAVLFGNQSRQSWDGMTQVIRTVSESHEDNIPIVIADCMCSAGTSPDFMREREQFLQKAYIVCTENYYTEGEALPGIEASYVAHSPVYLPFDTALKQDVVLYSSGSSEEDARVRAFAERLKSDAYTMVTKRIEAWFGEGELV